MNLQDLTKPSSVWEQYVPIIASGRSVTAYLTDSIVEPAAYNELIETLNKAYEGDIVTLHLNTPGGVVDSGIAIRNAIRGTKAKVVAKLTGTVASAGTMIALACDEIEVTPNLSFMCHEISVSNISGKFSDIKNMQTFYEKQFKQLSIDVYHGFLTDAELEEMNNGKELWFSSEEVMMKWDTLHTLPETDEEA